MKSLTSKNAIVTVLYLVLLAAVSHSAARADYDTGIKYRTVEIDGVEIFYREAGNPERPTILLLHGLEGILVDLS